MDPTNQNDPRLLDLAHLTDLERRFLVAADEQTANDRPDFNPSVIARLIERSVEEVLNMTGKLRGSGFVQSRGDDENRLTDKGRWAAQEIRRQEPKAPPALRGPSTIVPVAKQAEEMAQLARTLSKTARAAADARETIGRIGPAFKDARDTMGRIGPASRDVRDLIERLPRAVEPPAVNFPPPPGTSKTPPTTFLSIPSNPFAEMPNPFADIGLEWAERFRREDEARRWAQTEALRVRPPLQSRPLPIRREIVREFVPLPQLSAPPLRDLNARERQYLTTALDLAEKSGNRVFSVVEAGTLLGWKDDACGDMASHLQARHLLKRIDPVGAQLTYTGAEYARTIKQEELEAKAKGQADEPKVRRIKAVGGYFGKRIDDIVWKVLLAAIVGWLAYFGFTANPKQQQQQQSPTLLQSQGAQPAPPPPTTQP